MPTVNAFFATKAKFEGMALMAAGSSAPRMRFCCAGLKSKPGAAASAGALPAVMPAMLANRSVARCARNLIVMCSVGVSGWLSGSRDRFVSREGLRGYRCGPDRAGPFRSADEHAPREATTYRTGSRSRYSHTAPRLRAAGNRWSDKRAYNPGRAHAVLVPARRGARGPDGAHRRV